MLKIVPTNHSNFFTKFEVHNAFLSIVNGIRRTIYSKVETFAINQINFLDNTSVMHNEYIKHRISLIPILNQEEINIENQEIVFELDKKNERLENLTVTTNDMKTKKEHKRYIPQNIPIILLKPNEKLHFIAKLEKGNGSNHAKFIPVSVATFRNIPEIKIKKKSIEKEKANVIINSCPKKIFEYKNKKIISKNEKDCIFCGECTKMSKIIDMEDLIKIKKKEIKNKKIYEFEIESNGKLKTKTILIQTIEKLINMFENSLCLYTTNQNNYVLLDLGHTYSNILTEYLREDKQVEYSGYQIPHPLFNYSILKIRCKEDNIQLKIIKKTIKKIIRHLKKIKVEFEKL